MQGFRKFSLKSFRATPLVAFPTKAFSLRPGSVQVYDNGQLVSKDQLTLRKRDEVETYVLDIFKEHWRTTNKSAVSAESTFEEHGLDSLDGVELAMRLEDDLGYAISGETLPVFDSVKSYINYIEQVERYKDEFNKMPVS
eukprot:CAMPEP_0114984820 /NCGR_PEP_ID=MMETSP0216-20121206/7498_1 /TAXON_ID=223996 /ORGANISM="Protocruzia adherens, Strain Boccale" /LENGTH=139 /DNA_ID=CAMNT_0002347017 /DNA_START=33 /DNA_END=452 /DNA_ORIENTATION=-